MAIIFILFLFIVLGGSYFIFYRFIHPPRMPKESIPEDHGIHYEDVHFSTEDDFKLRGWFMPAENETDKVIIICHGYRANKTHILKWGLFLRAKYNLFYFDFRTHGKSQGRVTTFGYHEKKDIEAAIEYLRTKEGINHDQIGVMSLSMGARTALLSAQKKREIKAIVADSTPADFESLIKVFRNYYFLKWPLIKLARFFTNKFLRFSLDEINLKSIAKKVTTPVLLIHSQSDAVVYAYNSQMVYDYLQGPKQIWLPDCSEHSRAYYSYTREYENRVLGFFKEYL